MGRYNDIWVRAQAYEEIEKKKKKETREKIRAKHEGEISGEEDNIGLVEDERVLGMWETLDHKIIKKYVPPLFNPEPLPEKDPKAKGALSKYKKRYGREFYFLEAMKSPVNKIKNKYRYQIVMRFANGIADNVLKEIYLLLDEIKSAKLSVFVETNPLSLS